ncbi:MAG: phytoene/squalene synthase family protein [Actinophytocola sp.]|nr:phytoene/squalene synthase family protein [Actinophytocola sp.]
MGELPALSSELAAAYRACRRINARHGRTYFLATRLLPADRRPAVHALYGFARLADDIVDATVDTAVGATAGDRARALASLSRSLSDVFDGGVPSSPVLVALADTVRRYGISRALFDAFLDSMRMDLTVTGYRSFAELATYVHGSAEVIGLQLLPVLGTVGPAARAAPHAAALGEAFQLTNFLRDVGEDLDRGRVYLPAELAAFGVDRARLERAHRSGRPDPAVRRALAHLVAYNHAVYRRAEPGIALLRRESRPCMRTAFTLYRRILDEIVASDYAVLGRRVAVPTHRRLGIALPGLVRAVASRAGRANA